MKNEELDIEDIHPILKRNDQKINHQKVYRVYQETRVESSKKKRERKRALGLRKTQKSIIRPKGR